MPSSRNPLSKKTLVMNAPQFVCGDAPAAPEQAGSGGPVPLTRGVEARVRKIRDRSEASRSCKDVQVEYEFSAPAAPPLPGAGMVIDDWDPESFVFVPAAVYDGNRFTFSPMPYPPLWRDETSFRPDMPTTVADPSIPHLGGPDASTKFEIESGSASAPLVAVWSPKHESGFILQTEQVCTRDDGAGFTPMDHPSLLGLSVDPEKNRATLYARPFSDLSDIHPDCRMRQTLRLHTFPGRTLEAFLDAFLSVRKALNPQQFKAVLPFSAAFDIVQDAYNRRRWDEALSVYRVADPSGDPGTTPMNKTFQLGWIGGGMATLPLLMRGNGKSAERARRNLDRVMASMQHPSGYFLTMMEPSGALHADGFQTAHPHNLTMVRKQADWLYWALKQFLYLERRGETVPETWRESIRRLCDAFAATWRRFGQFGQFLDVTTSDIRVGGSCAGAPLPGALALAARYFGDESYLQPAADSARRYDREYVRNGYTTGGPGEILSAPDSESAFALIESFVLLRELTGKAEWREAARRMVPVCASWVQACDYPFPPDSPLGRIDARGTGAPWASIVNRHAAPAICTASGDALFRLWRSTGDPRILELITDIARGAPQYLSAPGRKVGELEAGGICERVNTSTWEGREQVGGNLFASCGWVETALLATCVEIPGLYARPDTGFFHVFDHITAEAVGHDGATLTLTLHNPTDFEATVSILLETSESLDTPLPFPFEPNHPPVTLAPGERAEIRFGDEYTSAPP